MSFTTGPHSPASTQGRAAGADIIPLPTARRWDDPLGLMQGTPPAQNGRLVLWTISILTLAIVLWAGVGKLDIIVSAEGKLVPQTLLKIVQPAEAGVVRQILVNEGDKVKAGQVLARLDTTLAHADSAVVVGDLAHQRMQERRIKAELSDQPMLPSVGEDPTVFAQVSGQYRAHRQAYLDSLAQERALLNKAEHERRGALQILSKLEQALPTYERAADAYTKLEGEGFFSPLATADKRREATEKAHDLDAQRSAVAALDAAIRAQERRIGQIQSSYRSELEKEHADIRARIAQLQPSIDKAVYREGLMELKAPQDAIVKDLATTGLGFVVQPGNVVMTLVPQAEPLFADVSIRNEDVGFVAAGQSAQIKVAAYPFQKYGMLGGVVTHIGPDATDIRRQDQADSVKGSDDPFNASVSKYKARVRLNGQALRDPFGKSLSLTPGMQVTVEIQQGKRTVLEYLLSPVQRVAQQAGRER
ncbi:HlyD family type I secretion periplasmic adaptor subunit [Herbaspirillum sp. WKF16]|uniref:HlyD family type I secretion periplasmic adaptor subunit n=1 Tax=Herbaspirillum sp. WKF16 TaxID=3028312 RepID=UPI0023A96C7E|nr:HlyD family type I secretion periplasmic adaptor subunit [Herbaspirillum sp. WKF16]WDZ94929.1 HlyD family type I secretion periplasmic adaptor subunit [Herbaspirillum sp. WKF16]